MVTIFMSSSCTSCRKAKKWLDTYDIPYNERNIFQNPITEDEIKAIMMLTENGTEEIISTRSKTFKELDIEIDNLSLSELFDVIQENPGILKRPIIIDDKRIQIGYNEDEIRKFIPRELRDIELQQVQEELLEETVS